VAPGRAIRRVFEMATPAVHPVQALACLTDRNSCRPDPVSGGQGSVASRDPALSTAGIQTA